MAQSFHCEITFPDAKAGVLHEKTKWDSLSKCRVENTQFQAKYSGFCNKDEDGDIVTDPIEFVNYVQTNVLTPLQGELEPITYFLKREAGKVPSKYTSFEEFKQQLDEINFTIAEPSMLSRVAYIEKFLQEQQEAGVFK